ncbi:gamma-glutamyltransferase [Acidaminococcus massiliensis]|uniref:gamma-glutamyltransferase n=1 Tax=Acidaminococcus massiliensis TaxID=1852375 RepID=UPI0026DDC4DF|nr:gamma-glutamyltransferase [Acidaminococcus massiliensis]
MPNHPYLGYQLNDIFYYRPYPYGNQGAVSSNSPYATAAGLEILKKGGNVFDAACAVSLTLGLVGPYHSGIGGGCFYVFYHKDSNRFCCCDARGVAPIHASSDMFLDANGNVDLNLTEFSGRSTAVPALYRALDEILQKYGTMSWEEVSAPAIDLARKGFYCGFPYARISDTPEAEHNRDAYEGFSDYYLHDGKPRIYGEKITNSDLADTMEQVAQKGVDWFYTGPIADEIVQYVQKNKGVMVKEDLVNCKPKARIPVRGTFRGYDIISMAPPSSGGTHVIQMLNILENFDLKAMGYHSAAATHVMAETMKMMFADRSVAMGDPDFVKIQLDKLLSKEYAAQLAEKIDMDHAQEFAPTEGIEAKSYPGCTTSFSIMDRFGNVFAQTQTIRNWWGCGVVIPHRGFIMNNAMADFSPKAGVRTTQGLAYGEANSVQPGKTPLSSMCPTLVFKDGKPVLAVGCAGGPRIITSVLQMIINTLEYGRMMEPAVRTPFMCCLTKEQGLELEDGFSPDTIALLEKKGHKVIVPPNVGVMSCMPNGIMYKDGLFYPAGTNRVDGGGGVLTQDGSIGIDGLCFK